MVGVAIVGVGQRRGWVGVFVEGLTSHLTVYLDIDAARDGAERLADERVGDVADEPGDRQAGGGRPASAARSRYISLRLTLLSSSGCERAEQPWRCILS
jgi:hypothetical protein